MAKKHLEQYDKNGNRLDIYLNKDEVMVGNETLADKLDEMDAAIEEAAQSGGTEPDTAMSDMSENAVQNKVIKAYVDAVSARIDTLIGSGNVQGAIDTFNEVTAFLAGISSSDTLAAKLALLVPQSRTINSKPLTGNITIGINDIDGLAAAIANAGSGNVSVIQPDPADGTFIIRVGSTDYTVNLNHTHENMAKLIVCEESDLPSTLANDTIYAITDSSETEIEKLIIRGMEFAGGGGTPSTDPRIISPIGTQIDFNGTSTKTVTIRASNLSEALTIAVTGVTANLQTISANDAANGVQLTLTKGQNFISGTLRIYSSEVDKSWNVIDSQALQLLTAIKLTGTQYFDTGYNPNPNTKFELDVKFEKNAITDTTTSANNNCAFLKSQTQDGELFVFQTGYGDAELYSFMVMTKTTAELVKYDYQNQNAFCQRGVVSYSPGSASFLGQTLSPPTKTKTHTSTLLLGYNSAKTQPIFDVFDMTVYGLKIYEGTTLLHDFVPAQSNGVVGLYDQQTSTFIASASGTDPEIVTQ